MKISFGNDKDGDLMENSNIMREKIYINRKKFLEEIQVSYKEKVMDGSNETENENINVIREFEEIKFSEGI